jgi:hypothetical protein
MRKKKLTQQDRIAKLEKAVGELYFFLKVILDRLDNERNKD